MSVSLTGRHHDWLSLTPRSIKSNGIQARYGQKAGAGGEQGWTGRKFSVVISSLCLCLLVSAGPCGRRGGRVHRVCIQLSAR